MRDIWQSRSDSLPEHEMDVEKKEEAYSPQSSEREYAVSTGVLDAIKAAQPEVYLYFWVSLPKDDLPQ